MVIDSFPIATNPLPYPRSSASSCELRRARFQQSEGKCVTIRRTWHPNIGPSRVKHACQAIEASEIQWNDWGRAFDSREIGVSDFLHIPVLE